MRRASGRKGSLGGCSFASLGMLFLWASLFFVARAVLGRGNLVLLLNQWRGSCRRQKPASTWGILEGRCGHKKASSEITDEGKYPTAFSAPHGRLLAGSSAGFWE